MLENFLWTFSQVNIESSFTSLFTQIKHSEQNHFSEVHTRLFIGESQQFLALEFFNFRKIAAVVKKGPLLQYLFFSAQPIW